MQNLVSITLDAAMSMPGQSLCAVMAEQGYLFIKGGIDVRRLEVLRLELLQRFDRAAVLGKGDILRDTLRLGEFETSRSSILRNMQATTALHSVCHDESLANLMKLLLGPKIFLHPRRFLRAIPGIALSPQGTTTPHQDHRYVQGALDVLTCWVPIGEYLPKDGGLMLVPASHRKGVLPFEKKLGATLEYTVPDLHEQWATGEYALGDVLIFHSCTVHSGAPNRGDRLRLSLDFRFQSFTEPIADTSLLAPFDVPENINSKSPMEWSKDPFLTYQDLPEVVPSRSFDDKFSDRNSRFIAE